MSEVYIRNFTEGDIGEITVLMQKLCEITNIEFDPDRWQASIEKQFQQFDLSTMLIAEIDGTVAGMTFASIRRDFNMARFGYISNLIVDPRYRGQRIGENLMRAAVDFFRQNHIESVRVTVRKESPEALNLLKKIGFDEIFTVMEQKI
ncbi:MAG TPA: GNAT family N-acetyltransferase [Candidatus Lokiarchaeia archaeon]|nr:GNAT family N-acetyltransferase [Candidatus Lokiarchaeia archaeon]